MIRNYFKHLVFCCLTSALVLLSVFFMVTRLSSVKADGGIPGGNISNPVVRAVDIAKPAVVRIYTDISGHVTVHITATQSATFPLNGGNYKLEFSGTGAFITAHGDILTANHVVNPPHDSDLDEFLFEMASQDVANYVNQNFTVSTPYSAQDALSLMADGNFKTETQYGQPSSYVYLSTDYTGPLVQTDFKNLSSNVWQRVDKIEQQSPTNVHDMAIIHVNMNDTPSIQLDDSSGVEQQDELTIIGFPGNADINDKNDPTQMLTSSVNKIYVSALKENDLSSPLIQVAGNVEHGDSGGPALDSNGNIVGVVSSYSSGADSPLGTSFLQASSSAQTLILTQGLDTTPGPFEKTWRQAFADYSSTAPGHWHKTQQELQKLSDHYLNFNAVTPYLNYAQNQASHEQLPTPPKTSSSINSVAWVIGIAGFVLLALIALACLLFFISKRNKGALATPALSSTPLAQPQPYATGMVPSNIPTYAFPEWPHHEMTSSEPVYQQNNFMPAEMTSSEPVYQQNNFMPAEMASTWNQQSFMATPANPPANVSAQENFPTQLPVPDAGQKDFPAQPPLSGTGSYRSTNFPLPALERRPLFSVTTTPPPPPFFERQHPYQFSPPPEPSPATEIAQTEVEVPTAKIASIQRQTIVVDANEKP
jgi:S1-C subfamily serine protease